jgi:putative acetyltransferase
MRVRTEQERDRDAVREIVAAEFDTGIEADFVESIRKQSAQVVSLVAEDSGHVVGHILLSPVTLDGDPDTRLVGLVSLAVVPDRQGEGIGSALMRAGLDRCRELDFDGAVALGHADYYGRFGFSPAAKYGIRPSHGLPEDALLAIELRPQALEGKRGIVDHLAALR